MKNLYLLSVLVIVLSCNTIQNEAQSIFSKKEIITEKANKKGIILIADGTYSGSHYYVVPPLTSEFTLTVINKMRIEGGGLIWVTFIDDNTNNNDCLFFEVPATLRTDSKQPTVTETGYVNFKKAKMEWQIKHNAEVQDSINEENAYQLARNDFIRKVSVLLKTQVYIKSTRNKWSDVNGSVSSSQLVLKQALDSKRIDKAYIVGFSDFEDDANKAEYTPIENIEVFNLLSQPGKSKNSIKGSSELVSEMEIFNTIKL